jgi:hypothetical protein
MTKMLFILDDPPYGTERSYNALRLAGSPTRRPGAAPAHLLGNREHLGSRRAMHSRATIVASNVPLRSAASPYVHSWPTVPGRERPDPWRRRAYWSRERPLLRVITTPASTSTGQRPTHRPPRDLPRLLWPSVADVASAWRESGRVMGIEPT